MFNSIISENELILHVDYLECFLLPLPFKKWDVEIFQRHNIAIRCFQAIKFYTILQRLEI